jgi:DNA mismatch repair protein MutS2
VAANADALRETLDALARFDFWAAKASLAAEMRASRAETTERAEAILLSARHPGLSGTVIPIDIRLGDGYTALVVTGPNTGGKTVTLRTLGLLSLMHQAGLHIPAEPGSRLPIWRDVFADIGDEQSIAQSLSTFSGHLRSIIRIVEAAGPGTLVLLDELGAGTDPTEGSALAQALLDHFIRAGALVAATTHYAELKAYAHTTPEARNAAVEFDLDTLSPTYRLTIGLPGGSQAFAIAERLGLPEPIVSDARSRLSESQRTFEATLASIKATEGETGEALDRARDAELRATEALRIAQEERRRARQERDDAVRAARLEAERIVDDLRTEVATSREALERATVTGPALDEALARAEGELARLPADETGEAALEPYVERRWRLGERARSVSGGWEGRIAALERGGKRATLEAGGMRVTVDVADLVPSFGDEESDRGSNGAGRQTPDTNVAELRNERARSVASSLDLRGARVDEALDALNHYLDDAGVAGLDKVLIIHGMGTGAVRDAVRSAASSHPLVKSMRPGQRGEGGDGATIVEF